MPTEFTLKVTLQQLDDLRDGLVALREKGYMQTDVEGLVKYSWAIKDTESRLKERARIADTLYRLFDHRVDDTADVEAVTNIAEAKRQKEALKALEDDEAREAADA